MTFSINRATRFVFLLGFFAPSFVCSAQDLFFDAPTTGKNNDTRWISHITREGGGFETSVYMANPTATDTSVTIRGYLANGTLIGTHTLEVSAMADRLIPLVLFFEDQQPSHLAVIGETAAIVTARYRLADADGLSAHVSDTAAVGTRFSLRMGEPDQVFDGVVVVNTSDSPVTIQATLVSDEGLTETLVRELAPNGKAVADLSNRFADAENSSVLIEADGQVLVTALRGSRPGSDVAVLFANPVTVVE
ncbi:hypothetical protein [Acanthopleuribacter pedis]|uniref:Alginate biosynthesis protein AlgF n=1 Tax=Acanthopleuribacter pedis TaxID=442870 RepID=A0A8J7U5N2_9BACT|nr:hypothetical protein [Acanthopleuribacter pedis]MBO1321029.1 hypothetical protein [Acanthopleuribacter pedis]